VKTISLKKVSAVAVASLGFGLLSVVPAQAAATANTGAVWTGDSATVAANQSTTVNSAVGTANTLTLKSISTAGAAGNMDITMTAVLPANFGGVTTNAVTTGSWGTFVVNNANSTCTTPSAAVMRSAAGAAGSHGCTGTFTYTPNVPGVYVLTATLGGTEGGSVLANGSITHVWTIYAGYDAGGTTNLRRAYPVQGSNTTTGWAATAGGQATLRVTNMAASTTYYVTTNSGAILSGTGSDASGRVPTAAAVSLTNGTNLGGGFNYATSSTVRSSDTMDIVVADSGSPASTTVKVVSYNALTGASTTFVEATVTWGVAATPTAQYSLVKLLAGAVSTDVTAATADTTDTVVSRATTAQRFTIQVEVMDQYNVDFNGATLAASISGPGTIGIAASRSATTQTGRSLSVALTGQNYGSVSVWGDGSAGKATVTITASTATSTVTLGTKTVTFAGSPSKIAVTQGLYVARAGYELGRTPTTTSGAATSVATTPAFTAEVTDSNGAAVVAGSTVKMTSSDSTVITVGTCAESTASALPGTFECSVSGASGAASGKTATVTFSVLNSTTGLYDIVASPLTFTIGGAISKVVVTTDKTSYTAGEGVNLTATATDSSGNKAYDGQAWQLSAATKAASNKSMGGALPAETKEIVNGKQSTTSSTGTASLFAPSTPGSFTIAGTYAATVAAPLGTAWSVTASVADGNAAIITQIDALNAKIVALNALIAKIMKKLGVK